MDTIDAAKAYAARGWHVIPLHSVKPLGDHSACSCLKGQACPTKSQGKHPILTSWQASEKATPEQVEAAFSNPYTDTPNVGLATGSASGFWVLDVDPDGGGFTAMNALTAGHPPLPATYRVRTGSGGLHFYWLLPDDFEVTNSRGRIKDFGQGIDVRGSGGQVVAPPSITGKGSYSVSADQPLVRAPAWLEDLLRPTVPQNAPSPTTTRGPSEPVAPRLARYTESAVARLTERLSAMRTAATPAPTDYRGEPWNITTFEVACNLIELANGAWNDYTIQQAQADLFGHAPRDRDFTDREVATIWASARNKIGDGFRPEPPPPEPEVDLFEGVRPKVETASASKLEAEETNDLEVPVVPPRDIFISKQDGLDADALCQWVMRGDPIGWGADEQFWTYHGGVWSPDPRVVSRRCWKLLRSGYRKAHVANVIEPVMFSCTQLPNEPHGDYMNFKNGMLEWRTGRMLEHSPDFCSTVQFPLSWNPDAQCPHFDTWLDQVLHEDYQALAWEMLGYLMLSGNPQQVAFLLYGGGGNGKGTMIQVIETLLGKNNCSAETLNKLNSDKFSAINLFGKIANIAGDIDGTYQESTAAFKALTGDDTYGGERKFGNRVNFTSWAVPVFSANKIPGSADVTEGYLRRWIVLKFGQKFKGNNRVLHMGKKLADEHEGIAVKAVQALRTMMDRGQFDIRGEALAGQTEFAEMIDQVRQWVRAATISMPGHFETTDDLYQAYKLWQEKNNGGKLSKLEFAHRLTTIGVQETFEHDMPGFYGLRVDYRPDPGLFAGVLPTTRDEVS